jgi:hypothetical protein
MTFPMLSLSLTSTSITQEEGTGMDCFVSVSLENRKGHPEYELCEANIKKAASQVFGGMV